MQLVHNGSLVVVLMFWAQLLWPTRVIADVGFLLLLPEEAEQLRLEDDAPVQTMRLRSVPQGPLISVELPQVRQSGTGLSIETTTPTQLVVLFERNRAPVE